MMSNNQKPFEDRMQSFKSRGQMKPDEIRRRRDDVTIEIRKQKREESLAKRRNFTPAMSAGADQDLSDDSDQELVINDQSHSIDSQLPELVQLLMGGDVNNQLQATMRFRKILSKGE